MAEFHKVGTIIIPLIKDNCLLSISFLCTKFLNTFMNTSFAKINLSTDPLKHVKDRYAEPYTIIGLNHCSFTSLQGL